MVIMHDNKDMISVNVIDCLDMLTIKQLFHLFLQELYFLSMIPILVLVLT